MIPHRYPFRFVAERDPAGGLPILCSAGDRAHGGERYPGFLGIEMLAQASILLLGDYEGSPGLPEPAPEAFRNVRLGGIQEAEFRDELHPGDLLVARARVEGRLGTTLKVAGTLERDGRTVLRASLLLIL